MTEQHVQTTENTVEQPDQVKVKKRGTFGRIKDKIKSKFHRHKKEKVVKNEVHDQDHIKEDQSSSDESDESGRGVHPDDRDLGTTQGTGQGPILGTNPSQSPIHERDFMTSHPELISDKSQYTEKSGLDKETEISHLALSDIPSTAPIIIRRRSICNERELQHAMTKLRHTEVPNSDLHEGVKIEYLQEKKAALAAALKQDMERIHLTHVAGAPDGSVSDKVKAAYVEEQLIHAIKDDLTRTSLAHVSNPPDGSISDKVKAAYVEEQLIHAIQDDTTRTSLTHVSNPPDGRVSEQAKAAFLEEQKAKGVFFAPPSGLREGVEAAYLGAYLEAQDQKAKDQVPIIHTTSTEDVAIHPKSENGLRPGVQAAYLGAYLEAQEEKAKLAGTGEHMKIGDEIPSGIKQVIKQVKEDGFVHPGVYTAYVAGYLEAQDELHGGAKALPLPEKGFGQKLMEGIQHVAQTAAEGIAEGIHSVAVTAAGMLHAPQETDAPVTGSHSRETVTTL